MSSSSSPAEAAESAEDAVPLSLSIVVPVYNERATIESVVPRVRQAEGVSEVILVNDGSTDGTREILDRLSDPPGVIVVHHPENRGKGAALKTGFARATGDIVIIQDADNEYDPGDYPKLLRPFVDARADVVYGSRFLVHDYARVHPLYHFLGNRFLTFLSNLFTGLNLTDMETCYKAFRREVLDGIDIKSKRFTVEPELTAKIAKLKNLRIFEVPINYQGRDWSEGKKIGWRDGVAAIWAIVKYRFVN